MTKILHQHMIVPSMSTKYNVTTILEALTNVIGAAPSIGCEYDKVCGQSVNFISSTLQYQLLFQTENWRCVPV